MAREHNQDAASSSPEKNQELLNLHENLKGTRKLVASGNSDIDGTGKIWSHNLHISTAYVRHLEKVLRNVRQRYGLSPGDKRAKLDVNAAIWRIFMSVTLQTAVHIGKDRSEILRSIKN